MKQVDLLSHAIHVLEEMGVGYMLVGSYASGVLGEPRLTLDIDVVIKLVPEDIPVLARAFPGPEFYFDPTAAHDVMQHGGTFNVIHPSSGNKIDFIGYQESSWSRQQLYNRRRTRILDDLEAYIASPEDVILSKMQFYHEGGHEKHLRDITGILRVQQEAIDREYIAQWAAELSVTEVWHAILRRLQKP